ncbi:hypothetical protein CapIbe_020157 [Capra ibex]
MQERSAPAGRGDNSLPSKYRNWLPSSVAGGLSEEFKSSFHRGLNYKATGEKFICKRHELLKSQGLSEIPRDRTVEVPPPSFLIQMESVCDRRSDCGGGRDSFSDQEAEPLSFHPLERSPHRWSWQEPVPGCSATFGGTDRRSWKCLPAVIGSL